MLWSFMAVFFSGWLYVDACYRGPAWQRWLFKPLTLLLLSGLAIQAPMPHWSGYLVLAGLLATLVGDTLTLLSRQQLLYASGAFFLSYLCYTLWFASQKMFTPFWWLPVVLLVIGLLLIALIWRRLEELRWAVCLLVVMTLVMVWLAGEMYLFQSNWRNLSIFSGALLLLVGTALSLADRYFRSFTASKALAAACYFCGHFLIVRTLYL